MRSTKQLVFQLLSPVGSTMSTHCCPLFELSPYVSILASSLRGMPVPLSFVCPLLLALWKIGII